MSAEICGEVVTSVYKSGILDKDSNKKRSDSTTNPRDSDWRAKRKSTICCQTNKKSNASFYTTSCVFEPKFTPNVQISQMSLIPGAVIFINYEALLDLVEQMPFCFRGTVCVHEEITGAVLRPVLRIVTRPRNSSTQGSSNGRSGFYAFLKVDCEWFESKFGSIQKTDHLIRMSGLIARLDAHRSNYTHPNGALMKSIF